MRLTIITQAMNRLITVSLILVDIQCPKMQITKIIEGDIIQILTITVTIITTTVIVGEAGGDLCEEICKYFLAKKPKKMKYTFLMSKLLTQF